MTPFDAVIFFSSLAGLCVLIWLLSLISTTVGNEDANEAADAAEKQNATTDFPQDAESKGLLAIPHEINAYRAERHSDDKKRGKREKITIVIIAAAAVFAAIAAVAAIVSAFIFQGQLSAMQNEQRAWLTSREIKPLSSSFVMHPPPYSPAVIDFDFANVGKEPARFVNRVVDVRFLDNAWDVPQISRNISVALKGKSCRDIPIDKEGVTVFPGDTQHVLFQLTVDGVKTTLGGGHWLMIGGCLAYQTMNETHWSDVCLILDPIDPSLFPGKTGFNTLICSTHNQAN
jgi:hypothetical protein